MKEPRECDWLDLKRFGRYLAGKPRVVTQFRHQEPPPGLIGTMDADHAGCVETCRSSSGYVVMHGSHCLKHGSSIQSTIALSSGESEFYSAIKTAAVLLGMKQLFEDLGVELTASCSTNSPEIHTDSSASKGTCERLGLGKLKHVNSRYLWIQERVARRELAIVKIPRTRNFSDFLTKPSCSAKEVERQMRAIGQISLSGRAGKSKRLIQGGA